MKYVCYMHHRNPQSLLYQIISLLHGYIINLKKIERLKKQGKYGWPLVTLLFICPFEKWDVLCYGVWRPSVHKLLRFRLIPPTVYIRSS